MKLNQVIAVEKSVKTKAQSELTDLHKKCQHAPLFEGLNKKYTPVHEEGEQFPPENKRVQITARQAIDQAIFVQRELFDLTATKDIANTIAKADVLVDGKALITGVPTTFLIFLEKNLTDLHTFVAKLPELDPAEEWHFDPSSTMHRTEPTKAVRTKKVQRPITLIEPTEKHPGQAQLITEDVTIGHWEQVRISGAIPAPEKKRLMIRIEKLQHAVKKAREEANTSAVKEQSIGSTILDYVLSES